MDRVRKIAITTGIVAMLSAGAVSLFAQGGPGRGAGPFGTGGRGGFAAGFALGQLNLSDPQKQQVRDICSRCSASARRCRRSARRSIRCP